MVKREIVKSAIAHRETAGIPYCVSFTPEAEKLVRPYFPGEDMQLAIGNYVYQISPPWWDWVNLPPSYQEFGAPDCLPQTCGTGSYDSFYRQCGRIRETTDCYILATVWGSHFEKAYFARGIENFLADLIENQDFARELLDMIIRKNMVMLENIVSCEHVDGVLLGSDWGSQKSLIMSPRVWREFIKPGELREYGLLKAYGKDVWIHSCGNVDAILPDLVEMGVDVLNPLQPECMDINEIKRLYGDRLAFWGGISTQQTLPYGTPDRVRAETRSTILAMGKGGGYIVAPSQTIQEDVPLENMLALVSEMQASAAAEG